MVVEQTVANAGDGHSAFSSASSMPDAQLVMACADTGILEAGDFSGRLRSMYPDAEIVFCSSGGEIAGNRVFDDSAVATAIRFGNDEASERSHHQIDKGECR